MMHYDRCTLYDMKNELSAYFIYSRGSITKTTLYENSIFTNLRKKHLPLPNLTDNWSEEHKKLANCFNVTKQNIANATPCPCGNGLTLTSYQLILHKYQHTSKLFQYKAV